MAQEDKDTNINAIWYIGNTAYFSQVTEDATFPPHGFLDDYTL